MKLHLPIAMLVAITGSMMSASATPDTYEAPSYTTNAVDANNDGVYDGHVTTTIVGDWRNETWGEPYDKGKKDGAALVGPLPESDSVHTAESSEVIIKDAYVGRVVGGGPNGYAVTGDKNITIDNSTVSGTVYGGYADLNGTNTKYDEGFGAPSAAYGTTQFAPKAQPDENGKYPTITINVINGSNVSEVYGGSWISSSRQAAELDAIRTRYIEQGMSSAKAKAQAEADIAAESPWTINEKVNININNATLSPAKASVYGGGMNGASVNNTTSITIDGADTYIAWCVYGGGVSQMAKSSQYGDDYSVDTYVGSTHIVMNDGIVEKSVCGGGLQTVAAAKSIVKGDTLVEINGGTVRNRVYGGAAGGVVEGNTHVILRGGSVTNDVFGSGYAEAVASVVKGDAKISIVGEGAKVGGTISAVRGGNTVEGAKILSFGYEDEAYTANKNAAGYATVTWGKYQNFDSIEVHSSKVELGALSGNYRNLTIADNSDVKVIIGEDGLDSLTIEDGSMLDIATADNSELALELDLNVVASTADAYDNIATLNLGDNITLQNSGLSFTVIVTDAYAVPGNCITLDLLRLVDGNIDMYAINALDLGDVTVLDSALVSFYSEDGQELTMDNVVLSFSEEVGVTTYSVSASTPAIPEPTTATLGLLALAGLAARRRRK